MCSWSTNVAFFIHSESTTSHTISSSERLLTRLFCIGVTLVGVPIDPTWGFLTDSLQLRSAWVPEQSVCVVLNTETSNQNATATLVSDVVLLLTMLVGLLRLSRNGMMSGFGQLLWKQVGGAASHLLCALICFLCERV